jgi:Skp family chaperone for outer membrane proteins
VLIDAVWQRFQQHADERGELLFAFEPWRQPLWERQLESPEDAVARFEAWWRVDPEGFHRQASLLMEAAPVEDLPRRVRCVLAAAQDTVRTRPLTASLAVFYAAAALANAFRAGEDSLTLEVEHFLEWFPGFEHRVLVSPPEKEERGPQRHFLEELYTEARLMRERLERAREEDERSWQQELRRKVAESRRHELERQAELAQREAEEAQRAAMAAHHAAEARQAAEAQALMASLRPLIERKPIDGEVLFPGKRLPTLVDYVRLLKVMSRGNPLGAMAAVGLEAATWSAEATAWGQAMVRRLELGLRFGELFSAPWE